MSLILSGTAITFDAGATMTVGGQTMKRSDLALTANFIDGDRISIQALARRMDTTTDICIGIACSTKGYVMFLQNNSNWESYSATNVGFGASIIAAVATNAKGVYEVRFGIICDTSSGNGNNILNTSAHGRSSAQAITSGGPYYAVAKCVTSMAEWTDMHYHVGARGMIQ